MSDGLKKAHNEIPNPIGHCNREHVDIFCNDKAEALAKEASKPHAIAPDWIVVFKRLRSEVLFDWGC